MFERCFMCLTPYEFQPRFPIGAVGESHSKSGLIPPTFHREIQKSHHPRNRDKPQRLFVCWGIESFQEFLGGAGIRPSTARGTLGCRGEERGYCGWFREIRKSHHAIKTMVETKTFVGIYALESTHSDGLLKWCRISSIQYW